MYVDVESAAERKRILVTGGSGVLGRAVTPLLAADGHEVHAPNHEDLDLFDPEEVEEAVAGMDAVMHLATRIPKLERMEEREAWRENDRLRTEGAHLLVGAALAAAVDTFVFPSIALFYPDHGRADEDTPLADVPPPMRSALVAEDETARFAAAGHRGVSLRLGLLDGPGHGQRRADHRVRGDDQLDRRGPRPGRRARRPERDLQRRARRRAGAERSASSGPPAGTRGLIETPGTRPTFWRGGPRVPTNFLVGTRACAVRPTRRRRARP